MNDIKYFIYARKSTDNEDKQVASITDQENEMRKIAQKRGLTIVDIISESRFAKEPGRSGFLELIQRIKKKEATGILVWKLNRLARNQMDGGLVSHELQQGVIEHIVTQGGEFYPSSNVLLMALEFGIANQYIKDLSVDTKRGLRSKAMRGWFPSSILPLGYKHVPVSDRVDNVEIVPDPKSFRIIRNFWDKMLTGAYTLTDIFEYSKVSGLTNKKGRPYSKNTISSIFDKPFYYGIFEWKDENGDVQLIKGKHKPMIAIAQFNRVQEIIRPKIVRRSPRSDIPLKGLMLCGNCNSSICGDRKIQIICPDCKNKFSIKTREECPRCGKHVSQMKNASRVDKTYYRCTYKKGVCSERAVTETELERQINEFIRSVIIPKEFFLLILEWIKDDFPQYVEGNLENKKQLAKSLTQVKNKLEQLILLRTAQEISSEEFLQIKKKLNVDKDILEKELVELESSDHIDTDAIKHYCEFLRYFNSDVLKEDLSSKKVLLQKLCSNLKLSQKSLYFPMVSQVLNLQNAFRVYSAYCSSLEPKNRHIKYSDFRDLNDLKSDLLGSLRIARTLDCKL